MNQIETRQRLQSPTVGFDQALGSLVAQCRRYWGTALVVFLVVAIVGIAVALTMPARYRSEARLLTLPSDYYAVRNRGDDRAGVEDFKPEEVMNVEMQLLSSQDIQRAALLRAGLKPDSEEALEKARRDFARNLQISQVTGANVIELSYRAAYPKSAQTFLDNLLAAYFDARARVLTSGRVALLTRQRDAAAKDMDTATAALEAYQARNNIADIDAQIAGAVQLDTTLRQEQSATQAQLSESRQALGQLRASAGRVPRTVEMYRDDSEATKAVADMQAQILQLQAKRSDLAGRYMDGSPLIAQVDKQIAGLESAIKQRGGKLREARRVGRNSYYDAAQDQLRTNGAAASGQAAKLNKLSGEVAGSAQRLRQLNGIAGEVARLKLRRDVAADRFRLLETQVEQARAQEVEAQTGSTNVRVIQRPTRPDVRDNPLIFTIAAALFAALLLAALALALRVAFGGRGEAAKAGVEPDTLGLPVLLDARTPPLPGAAGPTLAARLGRPAAGTGGHVVALLGARASDYADVRDMVLDQFDRQEVAPSAIVTFSNEAGAEEYRTSRLSDRMTRIVTATRAWIGRGAAGTMVQPLRERWSWVLLIVPPATDAVADSVVAVAAQADDVVLLVDGATARKAELRALARALEQAGRPASGVVLVGAR